MYAYRIASSAENGHDLSLRLRSKYRILTGKTGTPYKQCVYKRMVQFQKLTRNLFLTLHGQNLYRQQRQVSKFRMRYQQAVRFSCLLRGRRVSFQDGAAAGKGFLCAPF